MKHKMLSFLLVCCLLAALTPALTLSASAAGRDWETAYESVIQAKAGRSGCVLQLVDLDSDNTPELLIGSVPGSFQVSFVDYAYTYKNGQAKALAFTSGGDSVLSGSTESDYALKQYPKEAYTLYRNRSTGAYRVEGGHTVHGGMSMPNYWYIDTFSIKNDRLEVLPASFYVTYAIQYDVVTPSYYVNDAKTTKAAFDSARTAWYAGWEKVEGFPSCEQYFWSKPTAKETRDFLASYPTFWDVPSDAYYHNAVLWAYDKGITYGTSDTTFSPSDTVTRAQAMTFLWRAMGMPAPESDTNPFSDVKESDYYYAAVLWAVEQGITVGTSDSTFSPEQTCSTAHMVTFLYRTLGVEANAENHVVAASGKYNGHLYELYDASLTWPEAKAVCEDRGGHLLSITSEDEQHYIESLMESGSKRQYWIGLHLVDSKMEWVTGETLSYSNWDRGEPNHHSRSDGQKEDYVHIYNIANPAVSGSKRFRWNDMYYDNTYPSEERNFSLQHVGYICEYDQPELRKWYQDASAWAEQEGLLAETDKTVSYDTDCPRADVVTFLYRKLN